MDSAVWVLAFARTTAEQGRWTAAASPSAVVPALSRDPPRERLRSSRDAAAELLCVVIVIEHDQWSPRSRDERATLVRKFLPPRAQLCTRPGRQHVTSGDRLAICPSGAIATRGMDDIPAKTACAEKLNSHDLSIRSPLSSPSAKIFLFLFFRIVQFSAHPASLRGALRAIVTTREAGMRWTSRWRETNAIEADVKSCGPGIPTLMPSCSGDDPSGDGG
jgi:hypothetical protein